MSEVPDFKNISETDLVALSKLSCDLSNLTRLTDVLISYGIVLVFEPAIKGMKLDGAVFTLDSGHPVVAMSLKHSRLDYFWFTLDA